MGHDREINMLRTAVMTLCTLSSILAAGSTATAEPVVLVSNDGYMSVEGDLVGLDNNLYVVRTPVGDVSIPVSDVRCEGAGCPTPVPAGGKDVRNLSTLTEDKIDLFREFMQWRDQNAN